MTERETTRFQISVPASNGASMSRIRAATMAKLLSTPEIAENPHLMMLIATAKEDRHEISMSWITSELTKHFGLNVIEENIIGGITIGEDGMPAVSCECCTTVELYI